MNSYQILFKFFIQIWSQIFYLSRPFQLKSVWIWSKVSRLIKNRSKKIKNYNIYWLFQYISTFLIKFNHLWCFNWHFNRILIKNWSNLIKNRLYLIEKWLIWYNLIGFQGQISNRPVIVFNFIGIQCWIVNDLIPDP